MSQGEDRTHVIKVLRGIQKDHVCQNRSEKYCDCKFGGVMVLPTTPGTKVYPEQTGCPELRIAIGVLEHMTDREFKLMFDRARFARVNAVGWKK